jgi:hypothetical protein
MPRDAQTGYVGTSRKRSSGALSRSSSSRLPSQSPSTAGAGVASRSPLGNNIAIVTTDNDRRSGRQLQARVQHIVNDLDVAEEHGSRCYVQ